MKQNFFKLLLALLAICASTSAMAYDFEAGGIYYNKSGSNATVTTGDNLYSGTVTIPATVENGGTTYNVTAIANSAFANCTHLTAVNIGSNVETIGYRAFYGCDELTEVVIPDNVKTFGTVYPNKSETFVGCSNLQSVTIGAGVTSMGTGLFSGCQNLTDLVVSDGCT